MLFEHLSDLLCEVVVVVIMIKRIVPIVQVAQCQIVIRRVILVVPRHPGVGFDLVKDIELTSLQGAIPEILLIASIEVAWNARAQPCLLVFLFFIMVRPLLQPVRIREYVVP